MPEESIQQQPEQRCENAMHGPQPARCTEPGGAGALQGSRASKGVL